MISKRASLGLKVIAHIASTPSHRTTTADSLATATGVSLSYIEGILKDARELGLVQATRGPGGGYKLVASLHDLSVWDVISGFGFSNACTHKTQSSPEWLLTNLVSEQAHQFEKEFLSIHHFHVFYDVVSSIFLILCRKYNFHESICIDILTLLYYVFLSLKCTCLYL